MIKQLLLSTLVVLGTAGYVVSEKLKPDSDPIGLAEPANADDAGAVIPLDAGADTDLDAAGTKQPGPAALNETAPGDAERVPATPDASTSTTGSLRP
jgi:hypothetical protein